MRLHRLWASVSGLLLLGMILAPSALAAYGTGYRSGSRRRNPCMVDANSEACQASQEMMVLLIKVVIGAMVLCAIGVAIWILYRILVNMGLVKDYFNDGQRMTAAERALYLQTKLEVELEQERQARLQDPYWSQAEKKQAAPTFVTPVGQASDSFAQSAPAAPTVPDSAPALEELSPDFVLLDNSALVIPDQPLQTSFTLDQAANVIVDVMFIGAALQIAVGDSSGWIANESVQSSYQGTLQLTPGTWHIHIAHIAVDGREATPTNVNVRVNGPTPAAHRAA